MASILLISHISQCQIGRPYCLCSPLLESKQPASEISHFPSGKIANLRLPLHPWVLTAALLKEDGPVGIVGCFGLEICDAEDGVAEL